MVGDLLRSVGYRFEEIPEQGLENRHTYLPVFIIHLTHLTPDLLPQSSARQQALQGLRLLLTPVAAEEAMEVEEAADDWLLRHLPALPCFHPLLSSISTSLRQACQVGQQCSSSPQSSQIVVNFLN